MVRAKFWGWTVTFDKLRNQHQAVDWGYSPNSPKNCWDFNKLLHCDDIYQPMMDEQHNTVSLNIQWSYVLCGSSSSFQNWIVCVASPNTKCPNAVYTIILIVKFLSKNASYKLELHKFAPFKHLQSAKNELILYDFGRVPLHFDYLH